jgi:hypothetical protein
MKKIKVYKSNTEDYHKAFQVFLDHTDQKQKAKEWLEALVGRLPSKRLFIDAGAGNGKVTAWFAGFFERTVATEPNESLRRELEAACPRAEVHSQTILEASIKGPADFVLSSHVFYYIPGKEWLSNLKKLAFWLSPQGALTVLLQNHETDCMKMIRHFLGKSFDLRPLSEKFRKETGGKFELALETVPARIETRTFEDAFTIAEFMLNLLPLEDPPPVSDVEDYLKTHFASRKSGFSFSCNQDFLKIQLKK